MHCLGQGSIDRRDLLSGGNNRATAGRLGRRLPFDLEGTPRADLRTVRYSGCKIGLCVARRPIPGAVICLESINATGFSTIAKVRWRCLNCPFHLPDHQTSGSRRRLRQNGVEFEGGAKGWLPKSFRSGIWQVAGSTGRLDPSPPLGFGSSDRTKTDPKVLVWPLPVA